MMNYLLAMGIAALVTDVQNAGNEAQWAEIVKNKPAICKQFREAHHSSAREIWSDESKNTPVAKLNKTLSEDERSDVDADYMRGFMFGFCSEIEP